MKNKILSLAILVSLSLIFTVSCGSDVQAPSGALPTWKVGDTWTTRYSMYEFESTSVRTVTDEQVYNGIDCYTIEDKITMMGTTDTITEVFDKTTLQAIGSEGSVSVNGTKYTAITNTSWNYSGKPYPLSVGKTWTVTANETTSLYSTGKNNSGTATNNYTYKVENIESITVPAGTFQCFKIVQYDSNNSVVDTRWVTDITEGLPVKEMPNGGGTLELISYSLSE